MPTVSEILMAKLVLDSSGWDKGVRDAERGLEKLDKGTKTLAEQGSSRLTRLGSGLKDIASLAAKAGAALAAAAGFAAKEWLDFEKAFAEVLTLFDGTPAEIDNLRKGIEELSVSFGVDVVEATKAAYDAISAGVEPARVVDFLADSMKAATAGATDAKTSVNLLTGVLNAYGEEAITAQRASDILFATIKDGKTTAAELGASLGDVTTIAAQAGVSFAEVGAALATMTSVTGNTSKSVTALRGIIATILKPSKEAAEAFDAMGVSAESLRREGLAETLRRIERATGGAAGELAKVFTTETIAGAAALVGNMGRLDESLRNVEDSAGATEKAYRKMADTGSKQADRMREGFAKIRREIGERVSESVGKLIEDLGGVEAAVLRVRQGFLALEFTVRAVGLAAGFLADKIADVFGGIDAAVSSTTDIASGVAREMLGTGEQIGGAESTARQLGEALGYSEGNAEALRKIMGDIYNTSQEIAGLGDKQARTTAGTVVIARSLLDGTRSIADAMHDTADGASRTAGGLASANKEATKLKNELAAINTTQMQAEQAVLAAYKELGIAAPEAYTRALDLPQPSAPAAPGAWNVYGTGTRLPSDPSNPADWTMAHDPSDPRSWTGFQSGGIVPGVGSGDRVPALLEPGEGVIPRSAMRALGSSVFEALRAAGGAGPPVTVNVSAEATATASSREQARALAGEIAIAIQRGHGKQVAP